MRNALLSVCIFLACLPAFATKIQLCQDGVYGGIETESAQIVVGNSSGNPAAVDVSGDIAISNAGVVSISAGVVTAADMADAELSALGGLTSAANAIPYFTGSGTAGVVSSSANVVTFLGSADNAAMADIIGAAFTEGDLADSIIVTADIKDGEIVNADISDSAAIASTKLAVPCVRSLSQAIAVADFTDNEDTTGYVDLSTDIPACAFVIGWKFVGTGAFAGDTSAVIQVGKAGTLDAYSAATDGSVFTAATVGSECKAGGSFVLTATTPRITVTGGADFTSIVTDGNGAGTLTIYYTATE